MQISWRKIKSRNILIIWSVVIATLISCEEYQKGCMDASATNYQVSNQVPCCCEYPEIVFQTTLTDGMNTLSYTDTLINESGQRYLIRDFRFIASDITLVDSLGRQYTPVDTFSNYYISPDVMAVDVLSLNSSGGNFTTNGHFDQLIFSINALEYLESRMPEDFPLEHPFRDSAFYDFSKQSWNLAEVDIELMNGTSILLNLDISQLPVSVSISGNWTKFRGDDMTVNYRININSLFGNMDFTTSQGELQEKFWANFPKSFEP